MADRRLLEPGGIRRGGPGSGKTVQLLPTASTFKNVKELMKGLTFGEVDFAAVKAGEIIAEEAQRLAPLGPTGRLQFYIRVRRNKRSRGRNVRVASYVGVKYATREAGEAGKGANYAHIVEFGSARSRARPFMRPAKRKKQSAARAIFVKNLTDRINKKLK